MTQPEDELTHRIIERLDQGADQIDRATRERLIDAREQALERYRAPSASVFGLAWAGNVLARFSGHRFRVRNWIALATLLLVLSGLAVWTRLGPTNEIAEIDAGLLADELPINAYLDKGFDSWLKRGSR